MRGAWIVNEEWISESILCCNRIAAAFLLCHFLFTLYGALFCRCWRKCLTDDAQFPLVRPKCETAVWLVAGSDSRVSSSLILVLHRRGPAYPPSDSPPIYVRRVVVLRAEPSTTAWSITSHCQATIYSLKLSHSQHNINWQRQGSQVLEVKLGCARVHRWRGLLSLKKVDLYLLSSKEIYKLPLFTLLVASTRYFSGSAS